jgi:hypothetical protein
MSSPVHWPLLVVAAAAAFVGISAGPNDSVAVPAALVAIAAAGAAFWEASRSGGRPAVPRPAPAAGVPFGVRAWFSGGSLGRESIVLLLDSLDRAGSHPELPSRPLTEVRRLARLSPRAFREFVERRLDTIESNR